MNPNPDWTDVDLDNPDHHCPSCDRGELMAGHCVDIDGDRWHDCVATRVDSNG